MIKGTFLRSALSPIVNDAFKRATSAQQCALPDAEPFVSAIIGVLSRDFGVQIDDRAAFNTLRRAQPDAQEGVL